MARSPASASHPQATVLSCRVELRNQPHLLLLSPLHQHIEIHSRPVARSHQQLCHFQAIEMQRLQALGEGGWQRGRLGQAKEAGTDGVV